jgi:group II intron reverse transcriptase/maturase
VSVLETNRPEDRTTDLQSKLHQAAKRDPTRRFHALDDKLYLPYVLPSAWQEVAKNRGAAGIDRQTLEQIEAAGAPAFRSEIAQSLREKTYRPQPVRRVEIPTRGDPTRTRPLGIPTVRDRVVPAAAKLVLEPIFEADFAEVSFGFRPGKGPHDALAAVTTNSRKGLRWVVDADIEQFFDTLDHQQRMAALRRRIRDGELLRLIDRWLKAGYLADGVYHDTDQGSPQGGVLSPLLANVYLHDFDQAHQSQKAFVGRLTRYADDVVIQCGTADQAARALEWAREQLARLGLVLHPTKTRVGNDREEGFDFLGFHHRLVIWVGYGTESRGVIRWPSRGACQRFRENIRQIVGAPADTRGEWAKVRRQLQAYLGGGCHYFRHGQSTTMLAKLDDYVRERVARHRARSQPSGRRRRRHGTAYVRWLKQSGEIIPMVTLRHAAPRPSRGLATVRWRAV